MGNPYSSVAILFRVKRAVNSSNLNEVASQPIVKVMNLEIKSSIALLWPKPEDFYNCFYDCL